MGIRSARGNNAPRLSPPQPAVTPVFNDLAVYPFFIASLSAVYCLRPRSAPRVSVNLRNQRTRGMSMRSIRTLLHRRPATPLLVLAVVLAGWQCAARAQESMPNKDQTPQQTPTG